MGTVQRSPVHTAFNLIPTLNGRVAHLTSTNVELTSRALLDPTVTALMAIPPPPVNPHEWTNNS